MSALRRSRSRTSRGSPCGTCTVKSLTRLKRSSCRALAINEKRLATDGDRVANCLDSLGALHTAKAEGIDVEAIKAEIDGKPKGESKIERHGRQVCEAFYTRALTIREKILEPGHNDIATSLYNLGQLATFRGRPSDGERYLERWFALTREGENATERERSKGSADARHFIDGAEGVWRGRPAAGEGPNCARGS